MHLLAQFRVGDEIRHSVLMRLQKAGQSANGGVFARGTLEDNSGALNFICFDKETVERLKEISGPTAIVIFGVVQADRYGSEGAMQVQVRRTEPVNEEDDLSHLLPYTPKNIDEYKGYLDSLIEGGGEKPFTGLVATTFVRKSVLRFY